MLTAQRRFENSSGLFLCIHTSSLHKCIFFFSRERFDQPLCNMQKWKAAYLWYERTCVFCSRVYCTLFVIVLLQWKVIVRDPVCQRARVFLPLGLVHGCADTSVWSKAPLTSSCLSSTRARIGRLFWTLYF